MSLIASNPVVLFSAGTLVGVASTYLLLKFRYTNVNKQPKVNNHEHGGGLKNPVWQSGMEERFEFEDTDDEYRLMLGIRNDLNMKKGKVAAQCGHAAMAAYAKTLSTSEKLLKNWLRHSGTKIAVRIDSEEQMLELDKKAKNLNILTCIIRDAGQTQVSPGTKTVIAIGPAPKSVLDLITGHLKLY